MNSKLVSLGIILILFFNDFPLFGSSHLLRSPSFYPFIVGGLIWLIGSKGKVRWPGNKILIIFIIFVLISLLINIFNISNILFETAVAISVKNIIVLFFLISAMIYTYNVLMLKNDWIDFVEKTIKVSFMILVPYVLLEIIVFYFNIFEPPFAFIEKLFHSRIYSDIEVHKIRGYAFEGSYFSLVLAFLYPWILKSFLSKNRKWTDSILFIIFLVIVTTSQSRSIVSIFMIQTFLYVFMYYKMIFKNYKVLFSILILASILIMIGPILVDNIKSLTEFESTNVSNIIRFYSAYYAVQIGLDNPIFGTGIGLSGGHMASYYDDSIFSAYTAINWLQNSESLSVPVFSLLPKIMAEIGVIGLLLYLFIFLNPVWQIKQLHKVKNIPDKYKEIGIAIISMVLGLMVASFAVDTYYFYGYWISLAISYTYVQKLKYYEKNLIY